VSMVRSNSERNVGFLSDYRRMNVAITRAKRFICLVGDSDTVSSDLFLKNLVEYFTENGEVKSALEF
jgi:superfamily I DNA and/or RNA helicase